ncbi:MAG: alpha/beta hydrolase [Deltaproteobacteria bacterium]|nr:alpha/beta hydrolase [Deltaproteobacteria bacterium]
MKTLRNIIIIFAGIYLLLIIAAYLPVETVTIDRLTTPGSSFIDIDGKKIHYTKTGKGPALILVHGFGGGLFVWDKLIPLLSDNFTLYAIDLPGFGLSEKPHKGCYSMQCQAEIVQNFIKALDLQSVTIIGHSMGGVIAALCSINAPETISRLVIVEGGFYHGGAPAFVKYLFFPLQKLNARLFYTKAGRRQSLLASYSDKDLLTDELVDKYLSIGKTPNAVNALAAMMKNEGAATHEGISSRVTHPTLLVWSPENKNNPLSDGKRLQREINGSELAIIKNSGHYIQDEQPEALAAEMINFLKIQSDENN